MTKEDIINDLQFTINMTMYNHITGETRQEYELNDMDKTTVDACKEAIALLKYKPRIGHWKKYKSMIYCSECGASIEAGYLDDMNYCHNCGAGMESEEE